MAIRFLKEDGAEILLEDGGFLLLETQEVTPDLALLAPFARKFDVRGGVTAFLPSVGRKAVIEPAIGTVNGNNRDYRTPSPYLPGSTKVFLNGFVLRQDFPDGWEEKGSNWIQMKLAPLAGDDVQIYFRPL